jgi:hypothetical protein
MILGSRTKEWICAEMPSSLLFVKVFDRFQIIAAGTRVASFELKLYIFFECRDFQQSEDQ